MTELKAGLLTQKAIGDMLRDAMRRRAAWAFLSNAKPVADAKIQVEITRCVSLHTAQCLSVIAPYRATALPGDTCSSFRSFHAMTRRTHPSMSSRIS